MSTRVVVSDPLERRRNGKGTERRLNNRLAVWAQAGPGSLAARPGFLASVTSRREPRDQALQAPAKPLQQVFPHSRREFKRSGTIARLRQGPLAGFSAALETT